jgi:hypothetical protein
VAVDGRSRTSESVARLKLVVTWKWVGTRNLLWPLGVSEEHGIDIVFSRSMITVASVPSFRFLVLSPQALAAVVGERWPPLVSNAVRDLRTWTTMPRTPWPLVWGLDPYGP